MAVGGIDFKAGPVGELLDKVNDAIGPEGDDLGGPSRKSSLPDIKGLLPLDPPPPAGEGGEAGAKQGEELVPTNV